MTALNVTPSYPRTLVGPSGADYTFDDALVAVPLGDSARLHLVDRVTYADRDAMDRAREAAHPDRNSPGHHSIHMYGSARGPVMFYGWTWTSTYAIAWPAAEGTAWHMAMLPAGEGGAPCKR